MNSLFPAAERIARDDGIEQPGGEHLLLAALDLNDDIASNALSAFDVDSVKLRAAIVAQHEDAPRAIGVVVDDNPIAGALPTSGQPRGPYRSQGSLQAAFQQAVALAKRDKAALTSGYILLAITEVEHGTVVRALQNLGVDPAQLRDRTIRLISHSPSSGR